MTVAQTLYHRYKRYRSLQTDHITVLPIVILMPHSACNCRCIMCDIWKDNKNLKQLTENDISGLLSSLKKLETRRVLMSGGEALLNPNFFKLCDLLKQQGIAISLLSTGITLEKHAENICRFVDDVIVSLDGDETIHDKIRNIPGAYRKLAEGVQAIKSKDPQFRITARTVIQRQNFGNWTSIIEAAMAIGLDQISFLPADTSSHAFNREVLWSDLRQEEIAPALDELPDLKKMIGVVILNYADNPDFIAESPEKLRKIYEHYAAYYGLNEFPYKKCNAPWVSAVVEADGNLRPCFFHEVVGNIRENSLTSIINGEKALKFRKELDMKTNLVCVKCVCSLNLQPGTRL